MRPMQSPTKELIEKARAVIAAERDRAPNRFDLRKEFFDMASSITGESMPTLIMRRARNEAMK